jgi:8-oxo-dGTP diphosphatase
VTQDTSLVEVVAAVIVKPDASFLLQRRQQGKKYAGYWEFPGGKVESYDESLVCALRRELHEELGIEVQKAYPWLTQVYTYPHATVRLNFFRVTQWQGQLHGREDQALAWQSLSQPVVAPLLPANVALLRALALPSVYAISNAREMGADGFMRALDGALRDGLQLIQVREKAMPPDRVKTFAAAVVKRAKPFGAKVLINSDLELAQEIGADGVHLNSGQLMACVTRPQLEWVGASCHDARELERAARLGVDFVVLGPVQATATHPEAIPLGWQQFARLIERYSVPVYALGGLLPLDLQTAWTSGAHGIAMQRGAWFPSGLIGALLR